jgi:carboxyl-terminal processing protease
MAAAVGIALACALAGASSVVTEGPVDDTVREAVKSLEASSVRRVPLEAYATAGLDALAEVDRCLDRRVQGASVRLTCGADALDAAWPPRTSDEVASLLSSALRLVEPTRQIRAERRQRVARGLARAVDDPFTAYLPPDVVATLSSQRTAFFAATPGVDVVPRDPTRVHDVRRGSDADRVGLAPGDRIVAIDGVPTAKLTFPEITARLQGADDSVVRLDVERAGAARVFRVARRLTADTEAQVQRLDRGVLYVSVPTFKAGVAQRVGQLLGETRPTGVVLDLRHNGGGLVPEGIALADLFLSAGPIGGVRSGPGRPAEDFTAKNDAADVTAPLVVLVDAGSASASELVSLVLKDRGRARVLGAATAGKGSVQRQIHLPDGGVLKVTAGYYVGPRGQRLDEKGVAPDRYLPPASGRTVLEGGDARGDAWVQSAVDALLGAERRAAAWWGSGPPP